MSCSLDKDTCSEIDNKPGCVLQSVTCRTADMCRIAVPGVMSLIPVRPYTLMEIDHEIVSMTILLPSAGSRRVVCQLQGKVCAQSTG